MLTDTDIGALRDVSATTTGTLSRTTYDRHRDKTLHPCSETITVHAGTWNTALRHAGLRERLDVRHLNDHERRTLTVASLTAVAHTHCAPGQPLTFAPYEKCHQPGVHLSTTVILTTWGTWNRALAAAGLGHEVTPTGYRADRRGGVRRVAGPLTADHVRGALREVATLSPDPVLGVNEYKRLRVPGQHPSVGPIRRMHSTWWAALTDPGLTDHPATSVARSGPVGRMRP